MAWRGSDDNLPRNRRQANIWPMMAQFTGVYMRTRPRWITKSIPSPMYLDIFRGGCIVETVDFIKRISRKHLSQYHASLRIVWSILLVRPFYYKAQAKLKQTLHQSGKPHQPFGKQVLRDELIQNHCCWYSGPLHRQVISRSGADAARSKCRCVAGARISTPYALSGFNSERKYKYMYIFY